MNPKSVVLRERAERDIDEAVHHYLTEASTEIASGFIDALEEAYRHIGGHPASGSPRLAQELAIPGLRSWRLQRYPFLLLYLERADAVEVVRVLHAKRDIPSSLVAA